MESSVKDILQGIFKDKMMTEKDMTKHIKCLVIGASGTGKTYSYTTVPNIANSIFVDCERGIATLAGRGNFNIVRPKNWAELSDVMDKLSRITDLDTIFIDSLTEINAWAKQDVLLKMNKHVDEMSQYEWSATLNRLNSFILFIKAMPKNVIITCHERDEKDEDLGIVMRRPAVTGQLRSTLEREFDLVLFSQTGIKDKNTVYKWLTERTNRYPAKDRWSVLPKPSCDQDFTSIFNLIKAKGESK